MKLISRWSKTTLTCLRLSMNLTPSFRSMLRLNSPPESRSLRHSCRVKLLKKLVFKLGCNSKRPLERERERKMLPSPLKLVKRSRDSPKRSNNPKRRRRELTLSLSIVLRLLKVRDNMLTTLDSRLMRMFLSQELLKPRLVKSRWPPKKLKSLLNLPRRSRLPAPKPKRLPLLLSKLSGRPVDSRTLFWMCMTPPTKCWWLNKMLKREALSHFLSTLWPKPSSGNSTRGPSSKLSLPRRKLPRLRAKLPPKRRSWRTRGSQISWNSSK